MSFAALLFAAQRLTQRLTQRWGQRWGPGAGCCVLMLALPPAPGQGAPVRLDASPWNGVELKSGSAFGAAVAASDHRILVGVPTDPGAGWRAGAVYVFERVGLWWLPVARWTAEDGAPLDQFGHSVAITPDGRTGFVGAWLARGAVETSGAVYVFERGPTRWWQVEKLYASDGAPNDGFGTALATDGARLVVGACYADAGAFQAGSAYVFEWGGGTWYESAELVPSETSFLAGFGCAVSLAGARIAVGAPRADSAGQDSGAVFVFEHEDASWRQTDHLTPVGAGTGAGFGTSLALAGGLLAVGAPDAEYAGVRAGRATLFTARVAGWTPLDTLGSPNPAAGDAFGSALALGVDELFVGAPRAAGTGAVLRFVRTKAGWSFVRSLFPPGGRRGDAFGTALALTLDDCVIGAPGTDSPHADDPGAGADVGAAFVIGS